MYGPMFLFEDKKDSMLTIIVKVFHCQGTKKTENPFTFMLDIHKKTLRKNELNFILIFLNL